MTKEELSRLYYLNKEIDWQERRLQELETAMEGGHIEITGVSYGKRLTDRTGKFASEIADLKMSIEVNVKECWQELKRLSAYIDNIEDIELRQIMRMRHIEGLTWERIGEEMGYERSTANKKYLAHFKPSQISQIRSCMM